ncbi:uncharacterized protein LOC110730773 [Chenopodium quinoa]|uniref:uncharacterized protein LOC110730773 n=1 Tax=Chenopodium quinoa TaxID=63459 RepID=UPI000B797E62|nr:uncharacterized protein LOC110730773 [Chenopodium quinoa]
MMQRQKVRQSLFNAIGSFEFLLGMVIWYDILFAINMISKKLQSKNMCIDDTIKHVEEVVSYFEKYREEGFTKSMSLAKIIAFEMDVEPIFPTKRTMIRKKYFGENNEDQDENMSPEESFRVHYFLVVVDMAITSLKNRFEELKTFERIFDVDVDDLFSELKVLQFTLPNNFMSAIDILKFVKLADSYPNVSIEYRVLLTVPVTVASAERSFSKLKLIKTYLRSSSMS